MRKLKPPEPLIDALFLDLDGTLVDIAPTPKGIDIPAGLILALTQAHAAFGGAIAINTGRPIAEIDHFLAPIRLAAGGVHGAEIRSAPDAQIETVAPLIDDSVVAAARSLEQIAPGVIVEAKRCSVAVHFRNAPDQRQRIEGALEAILATGPDHLILSYGRKVIEIVPRGVSKGAALAALMRLPPFAGRRPIMIGDDRSDQSAFDMAESLGGIGARVAGELYPLAQAQFTGPADVLAWLAASVENRAR